MMTEKHEKKEESKEEPEKSVKDEEIAIDLSKITSIFKKKEKKGKKEKKNPAEEHQNTHQGHHEHTHHHAHASHHAEKEKEAEDKHVKTSKKNGSEDLKREYKETLNFMKKYAAWFLVLIPIILTIFLRLQPAHLPMTDEWAQNSVYSYYKNQVATQVNQQYPNLPDANKNSLINSEFLRILTENKDIIDQQIETTSQQFKERMMYESGNSKYTYLGDIDSYYWLRDARKFLQNSTMCDEIDPVKGLCYLDTYTAAPIKSSVPLASTGIGNNGKSYAYVIAYVYKFLKIFKEDMTIMQASFYVPLIFGILSAILAFLIGKTISGNLAGLITSIFISVNPIHLSRTLGSDNDPQNIFFPLLIVLFLIYTFKTGDVKKKMLFGTLTGLSISLFAASWQGWWFMFDFIIATLVIYVGFYFVRQLIKRKKMRQIAKTKETKNILVGITSIFLSSAILITLMGGLHRFLTFFTGPLWFTQTKVAAIATFWPNVLVTVAEFNPGSIPTIISQMGGKTIFFLGLLGVLFVMLSKGKIPKEQKYLLGFGFLVYLLLVSSYGQSLGAITYMILIALPVAIGMILLLKSDEEVDVKLAILLVIWFAATTYATLKGVRFTLLMVSAFSVAFGITISAIYKITSKWISSELKINEAITKTVVALVLLLILISPVKAGYYTATHYMPSVNDAWYDSLTNIKENSEPDAIINSWWDFGHWFKYIADRRVTLDGSSQGGPPLHWLGKLMVTDNERQSVGILRMLDCGSNNAFNTLNAVLNDTAKSIKILDEIVTLDKKEAGQELLNQGLTKEDALDVLKYTHCEPPEDFFITSEDMVGKSGVWAHFGSWDFSRAEMYNKVKGKDSEEGKKILMDPRYNLTPQQADQYYYEIQTQDDSQWITPWPSYMSSVQPCEMPDAQGIMTCNQAVTGGQQLSMIINLTDMDVKIKTREDLKPTSIVYVTETGTEERKFSGSLVGFSVVLVPMGEQGYGTLITHPYLANSIFTRLFYLGGHGLSYFDQFSDKQSITGGRIIVWKVDWNGTDPNVIYQPLEAGDIQGDEENTGMTGITLTEDSAEEVEE